MDAGKRRRLEAAGWTFGDYGDFLGMTDGEREVVEMHLAAARELERLRTENPDVSQAEMARRMGTRQPNVSRMLRNPSGATLDTLFRALAAFGLDRRKIAALFM